VAWRINVAKWARSVWPRRGFACYARTRFGTMCRGIAVVDPKTGRPRNGRCRMHGGTSTGPRTPAGKLAIARSNRRRAAARKVQELRQ
jgi:hypothetical protein